MSTRNFVRLVLQAFAHDIRAEVAPQTRQFRDQHGEVELGPRIPLQGREWDGVCHAISVQGGVTEQHANQLVDDWLASEKASNVLAFITSAVKENPCKTYFA